MGLKMADDFHCEGNFLDTVENLQGAKLNGVILEDERGVQIELLKDEAHPSATDRKNKLCDGGIRHIAILCSDADSYFYRLRGMGFETLSEPQFSKELSIRVFFVRDPEGNLVEIVESSAGVTAQT